MLRAIRPSSIAIVAGTLLLGSLLLIDSVGGPIERAIDPLRFAAHERSASGNVVIVEMDAQSAATIGQYPWPRRNYATVVDALRRAGASSIVFDIDFSSASNPHDDAALAGSLARAGGIVALPTFGQRASAAEARNIDALPLPMLRDHVALASVSVAPDQDGLVREMPFATITADTPRPSLSAFIAARAGSADASFPIDFSIDPASIPRASFIAVRDGRVDPRLFRGRNILIGATAIEMGDRYATPLRGVLPGVVVQALAAETLIAGVPVTGSRMAVVVAGLLLTMAIVARRSLGGMLATSAAAIIGMCSAVLVLQHGFAIYYPLVAGIAMLSAATGMCIVRDVLSRFRTQSLVDEATGLPNRRAFVSGKPPARATVALYQINNLDMISAVLGGQNIDQVVMRVADRLRLSSANGEVYRVRGQHLAFYLGWEEQPEDSLAGLRALLLQPVEVAGRKVDVTGTIGVAGDQSAEEALTDAALAAEEAGRDGVFWRRRSANMATIERSVSLMGELDAAISGGQLLVYYQPKLSLAEDKVTGVEALVRWQHPERGFISPDEFIGLAEQSDRIEGLTLFVLDQVLSDVSHWRVLGHDIKAAINISAKLISSTAFNAAVKQRLAANSIPARALTFEVTESAALSDPATAIAALTHYRGLGVSVSLDDYGTGQSTLSYLRQLPIDELKIDKSFVQNMHRRDDDRVLVASTVDLAHRLRLRVVAEGVEDAECLSLLRELGCDYAQGYFVSRPVPADELLAFLASGFRSAA